MTEPCKVFSVNIPYRIFEKVKGVAKGKDLSVSRVIRFAIEEFLSKEGLVCERTVGDE